MNGFHEILRVVMSDPKLMAAMTSIEIETELFARVIELGQDRGISLTLAELEEIVLANRRAWFERWLA